MITFSANIQSVMASGNGEAFYLLAIREGDGTLLRATTTHFEDILMGNGINYEADDYLQSVDAPHISSNVDREQFKIALVDPSFMNGSDAEKGFIGKRLELIEGFINPVTGKPFTDMVDTFTLYKGQIDSSGFKITTIDIGESIFAISGASPMAALEMARNGLLTKEETRARNPNDSSMDLIYEGSGTIALKWGKV